MTHGLEPEWDLILFTRSSLWVFLSFFHLNYFFDRANKQAEWMSGWAHWVCLQQPGKLKYVWHTPGVGSIPRPGQATSVEVRGYARDPCGEGGRRLQKDGDWHFREGPEVQRRRRGSRRQKALCEYLGLAHRRLPPTASWRTSKALVSPHCGLWRTPS